MDPYLSDDCVALVTGGYKNIGLEISRILVKIGSKVIATYRTDKERAMRASEDLGIEVHRVDMSMEQDVDALFNHLEGRGLKVGILVNNVSSFPHGPLSKMNSETFRDAFRSCVFSTFYATNRSIPHMRSFGWGRIINIGMAGTSSARPYIDVAAHASAKNALSVISLSYARELADDNITVNMISPGIVNRHEMDEEWREKMRRISGKNRLIEAEEIVVPLIDLIKDGSRSGEILEIKSGLQTP